MFHSFRAVEGLLSKWAIATFPQDVTEIPDRFSILHKTIVHRYPTLKQYFDKDEKIELNLRIIQRLIEADIPTIRTSRDFEMFWIKAKIERNKLFHRIVGQTQNDVYKAWGDDINNPSEWETRIINCLNLVTKNKFQSLTQASLFESTHQRVKQAIKEYQPSQSLA
jgi:hypothetical protein